MRSRIKTAAFVVLAAAFLAGCAGNGAGKETVPSEEAVEEKSRTETVDKIDEAERLKGIDPFTEFDYSRFLQGEDRDKAVLAVSPDKKSIFLMARATNIKDKLIPLKGAAREWVKLYKLDIETGKKKIIADNMPFIKLAKWDSGGNYLAFLAGGQVRIYDDKKDTFIMQEVLENDRAEYFGWSPDGKKLYTEHPNLPNGSIYYLDTGKVVHKYETDVNIYYKGRLNEDYYYGTSGVERLKDGNAIPDTVILDKNGNIASVLPGGCFRDSYMNAALIVGSEGFGLNYLDDVNRPDSVKQLSDKYIFDAKFTAEGNIAFITDNGNADKNTFLLYVLNGKGEELKQLEVSGSALALLPDGKTGFIGGPGWEKIDFSSFEIVSIYKYWEQEGYLETEKLYRTIRGAADAIARVDMIGEKDMEAVGRYFIDTENPSQWARFDVETYINERKFLTDIPGDEYMISLYLESCKIKDKVDGTKTASVKITGGAESSGGSGRRFGAGLGGAAELVMKDGTWYLTGYSTFPDSKEAAEARKKAEQYLMQALEGKLFDGAIKGKTAEVGQVQFWQMSSPHMADSSNSNYCKVFIKVYEGEKEKIYKMVMKRDGRNNWKAEILKDEPLHWLF